MRHLRFFVAVAFFMLVCTSIQAQTPLARLVLPTNTTETAVQPTFRIITSLPIDSSSVLWNLDFIDSTSFILPVVCVMPYQDYTSVSDTFWQAMAIRGSGQFINDTTIEFTPNALGSNRTCEVILKGLRVISGSDTISISDTVARMKFTTIGLPPRLISISCIDSGSLVRMHDTITAQFSSSLDSANSPGGPILSMATRHISYDTTHDSLIISDSTVSSTAWLDASDSSVLHLLPSTPFNLGGSYFIRVNLSGLTGDTTQDAMWGFTARKNYRLKIATQGAAGLTLVPRIHFDPSSYTRINDSTITMDTNSAERVVDANDTVSYSAPAKTACAEFWKWSCPGYPAWDNSTSNPIVISLGPDHLADLNLVALYKPIPLDTLIVSTTCPDQIYCGNIEIRGDSAECGNAMVDTCTSSCNYYVQDQRIVSLRAYSSSKLFQSWSSSDPNIDGSTSPYVQVLMSGTVNAVAYFASPPSPPPPFAFLCASIQKDKGHSGWSCYSNIANILTPDCHTMNGGCVTVPYGSSNPVIIKILDHTYGLKSYIDASGPHNFGGIIQDLFANGGDGTFTITEVAPANVTFVVAKLEPMKLTLEIAMDDENGRFPLLASLLTGVRTTGYNLMWCAISQKDQDGKPLPFPWVDGGGTTNVITYTIMYERNTKVELSSGAFDGITLNPSTGQPFTDEGFVFKNWDCDAGAGYTDCNPPSGTNPVLDFTMDQPRKVRAWFHEKFRLETITYMYVDANDNRKMGIGYADNWPPSDGSTNTLTKWYDGTGWDWKTYNPPAVQLRFNKDIRHYTSISCIEKNAEYGQASPTTIQVVENGNNQNTGIVDSKTLRFALTKNNNTNYVWKGQQFLIDLGSVQSAAGEPLFNASKQYLLSSVNPDVEWYYKKTYMGEAHTNGCFNSYMWVYWAAQHGWTAGKPYGAMYSGGITCFYDNAKSGSDYTATNPEGDDDHCGSTAVLMTSSTHAKDDEVFSAGAVCHVSNYKDLPSGPLIKLLTVNIFGIPINIVVYLIDCLVHDNSLDDMHNAYRSCRDGVSSMLLHPYLSFDNPDAIGNAIHTIAINPGLPFDNGTANWPKVGRVSWWGAQGYGYNWDWLGGWSNLDIEVQLK